jgi:hypothetical protein
VVGDGLQIADRSEIDGRFWDHSSVSAEPQPSTRGMDVATLTSHSR